MNLLNPPHHLISMINIRNKNYEVLNSPSKGPHLWIKPEKQKVWIQPALDRTLLLLSLQTWKLHEMFTHFQWSYYGTTWARIGTFWIFWRYYVRITFWIFTRNYVRITTKSTTTLKSHSKLIEDAILKRLIKIPIWKYQNLFTELVFMVKIG